MILEVGVYLPLRVAFILPICYHVGSFLTMAFMLKLLFCLFVFYVVFSGLTSNRA